MDVGVMGKRRLLLPPSLVDGQKGLSITVSLMAATEAGARRVHFSQREAGRQITGQEILP